MSICLKGVTLSTALPLEQHVQFLDAKKKDTTLIQHYPCAKHIISSDYKQKNFLAIKHINTLSKALLIYQEAAEQINTVPAHEKNIMQKYNKNNIQSN